MSLKLFIIFFMKWPAHSARGVQLHRDCHLEDDLYQPEEVVHDARLRRVQSHLAPSGAELRLWRASDPTAPGRVGLLEV